jgi:DNA-binding NtrC family response regulator
MILHLPDTLDACERRILADALAEGLTMRRTAKALGVSLRTLYYRLRRHNLT